MKKLIVFTHNPVRDPVTDDCLCVALRRRGHVVFRRNFLSDDKNMILCIKPHIVVLPEIRCEYTLDLAKQCKAWGCQIVVRPCEVGISEESVGAISEDYRRAIFGNWPVNDTIDLMLMWGPKMQELFCKHGGIDPAKTAVVGGLAFDQFFLPPPPDVPQRTDKRRVLFATGFAYADRNPQYSVPEARAEDPIHADMVRIDSSVRAKWFEAIRRFCNDRSDEWEIWVKLHPGEKEEVYREVLKDLPVVYCPPLPAVRALRYVDVVVHAGSTMAFEAHLMDKPAFNFHNVCQDKVVAAISPQVEDYEGLISGLDHTPSESNADPAMIEKLTSLYYGTCDGKASERAAEAISKLPDNTPEVPDHWPAFTQMKYMTDCVIPNVEMWECRACQNRYYIRGPREMVKCPYCGIANVKIMKA